MKIKITLKNGNIETWTQVFKIVEEHGNLLLWRIGEASQQTILEQYQLRDIQKLTFLKDWK